MTIFALLIYLGGIFVRITDSNINFVGLILISGITILTLLQTYFLIIKNRKGILLTNIHLVTLFSFIIYEVIIELITYKSYNRNVNGMVFGVFLLLISMLIVNKFKVSKITYDNVDEIGQKEE